MGTFEITTALLVIDVGGHTVTVEICGDAVTAWDNGSKSCRAECGTTYHFAGRFADHPMYEALPKLPHLAEVSAALAEHHEANRDNPLGAFILPAVVAMQAVVSNA